MSDFDPEKWMPKSARARSTGTFALVVAVLICIAFGAFAWWVATGW